MSQVCPKCSYARKPADASVPDWQCPSCGIAYAKFTAAKAAPAVAPVARELFARQGVTFVELDIEADARAKSFHEGVMGRNGFPTIVIGNRVTFGFDEAQILASLKEI